MKKISILTCVIGEPENLINTFNSISDYLSENFTWTLKFHESSDTRFIESFKRKYVSIHKKSDLGLYDAMNQGLELMTEDYYFVLGAGDELNKSQFPGILSVIEEDNFLSPIYFFPVQYLNSLLILHPVPENFNIKMGCPHPGTLLNRINSLELGGYDTKYRIASDYDHVSRYLQKYGAGKKGGAILANILAGGMSEQRSLEAYLEEELIRKRVWQSVDWAIYDRMLKKSSENISHFVDQILNHTNLLRRV